MQTNIATGIVATRWRDGVHFRSADRQRKMRGNRACYVERVAKHVLSRKIFGQSSLGKPLNLLGGLREKPPVVRATCEADVA